MTNLHLVPETKPQPGCVKSPSGRYLPIVMTAHDGVYFSGDGKQLPSDAVAVAMIAISDNTYPIWHYHSLSRETK